LSEWRRRDHLGDFARGLSLASLVALSVMPLELDSGSLGLGPDATAADLVAPFLAPPAEPGTPSRRVATVSAVPDRVAMLDRGETLGDLLQGLGLPVAEIDPVVAAAAPHLNPRALRPGLAVAAFDEGDRPARFEVALAGRGALTLNRRDGSWRGEFRPYTREVRRRVVRGVLEGSFERSLARVGAQSELGYAVAEVLQWDLDFTRDLQNGDRFETMFEEIYLEGESAGLGRILAVRYVQEQRTLEAFRFGAGEAFYDGEGRPLEKMFLRAPLPYSRVTSKFSMRRFHPVLKVARPHYGVDYGAPVGTPVRVTATGTVQSAGWDGGGGKTVKVRHANGFLTGYLHLSRFADGIRAGARVKQGDIIGYVGSTGLASGPHLDYRVQHQGRWIDPLSLKSVPAEPISVESRQAFEGERDAFRVALASGDPNAPARLAPPAGEPTQIAASTAPTAPNSPATTKK
jgi:murein DD-endopeptidase MepM/ murein hydrolase activator NlpD